MSVGLGIAARFIALWAQAQLLGVSAFLLLAGPQQQAQARLWRARQRRWLLWAALALPLSLLLWIATQAQLLADQPGREPTLDVALLSALIGKTLVGHIWAWRLTLSALMLMLLALSWRGDRMDRRPTLLILLLLAALTAGGASLAGHAAGGDDAWWLMPLNALHIVIASAWLGALPSWLALARLASAPAHDALRPYAIRAFARFSTAALPAMGLIVAAGIVLSLQYTRNEGDWLGTRFGLLMLTKIVLLLLALHQAWRLRQGWLPQMQHSSQAFAQAARCVSREWALALAILLAAATLAQTTPATHEQPLWYLPFRLSLAATWKVWPTPLVTGLGALAIALGLILGLRSRSAPQAGLRAVALLLCAGGLAATMWALAVPAYPDTFRRSTAPYLTVSIAHGQALFEMHCVACHGRGALGDGVLAKSLPKPPVNLSEPHTALHTVGDMYWWFSHGIPQGGMPGFAAVTSEQDRWDLANFLRAFSQGFEARILSPQIVRNSPWLGAPNFYYETAQGEAELKDWRERQPVLLVFFDPRQAQSRARLDHLAASHALHLQQGLQVLAIAIDGRAPPRALPFTVVTDGAAEIWSAYQLLSRSLGNRGDGQQLGMNRSHAEFLIDRYGYVRARWLPDEDPQGWSACGKLIEQVQALASEPRLRPPPDDHVH